LEHFEGIESYSVKHLPIVKAYADRLGLVELVNHLVPSQMELPPGIFFLGMVLDTLSGRNPLYRLEHFFKEQDTELLLSKEVGYDSKAILEAYKDQYGIEQDFGFLKDPVIVNSFFLKKPKRIEVLGLILLTSLLIWRLMERSMRQYVAKTGEKLPGWDRKPTDQPTSFMMTTKFMGIMVIKIGNERRLSKPLYSDQEAFLLALGIKPSWLIRPQPG